MKHGSLPMRAGLFTTMLLVAGCVSTEIAGPPSVQKAIPVDRRSTVISGGAPDIRIGVVPSASAINLGSAGDFTISDGEVTLRTGSNGAVKVELVSAPASYYRLQITCSTEAAQIESLRQAVEALNIITMLQYNSAVGCTRLLVGQFPIANSFGVRTAFKADLVEKGLAPANSFYQAVPTNAPTVYKVSQSTWSVESLEPVTVTSSTGIITINGVQYRGTGQANVNSTSTLAGINQLPLEQYLYGVVPKELGPIAFPEIEAQKVQAVAARTYALAGLGKRAADHYDLLATTSDQVYGGYSGEYAVSNAAVDATAGIAVTYAGNLISALYSSTSGGHTADNEEAFEGEAAPYLRGVPDAERGNALEHVPSLEVFRASANPMSLRAAREGDYESDWSKYHRWTFEWTPAEITSVVSSFAGVDVGAVHAINVLERGPSGRALRLEYVTDAGNYYATKEAIRASLRTINAAGTFTNLPSTLFFVEPVVNPRTKTSAGFRVYGGGFGHGVGMSQTGAEGMAEKGHSYEEILHHYYTGVDLTQWY